MPRRVRFTEEEKEEDIKEVEAMLRDNPNCHEIAADLGRSVQYVCDIKDYLDKQGILTKEELEQIILEKIDEENRVLDEKVLKLIKAGKNKNKIHKILKIGEYKVDESYERLSKVMDLSEFLTEEEILGQERMKKIKDFVNDGTGSKSLTQIVTATNIPSTTVNRMIDKLISNGSIKEENIINEKDEEKEKTKKRNEEIYVLLDAKVPNKEIAKKYNLTPSAISLIKKGKDKKPTYKPKTRKKDYDIKEPDDSLSLLEKNILEYLKKGLSYNYICKKENLLQSDLMNLISSLKDGKYITQTIINEARETRRQYYLDIIEKLLKKGYSNADIYREINKKGEELTTAGIYRIVQKIIDSEKVTKEDIEKAREEEEDSFASIDSRILPLIKSGYTVKEIIESDETGYLTESRVRRSKERIIASENITKEQLKKWQKQRELEKQQEVYEKDEKIIWNYVKEYGYDDKDIAPLIDACTDYVGTRRRTYQKKNKISDEKFKLIKAKGKLKRKQKEEEEENKKRKVLEDFCWIKDLYKKEYESLLPKLTTKQRYFEQFKEVTELGIYSFMKEDVDILSFIVLYEETFLNDENIKYVMEKYLSIGEEDEAIRLLNSYINGDSKPRGNDFIIEMRLLIQNYKQGTKC